MCSLCARAVFSLSFENFHCVSFFFHLLKKLARYDGAGVIWHLHGRAVTPRSCTDSRCLGPSPCSLCRLATLFASSGRQAVKMKDKFLVQTRWMFNLRGGNMIPVDSIYPGDVVFWINSVATRLNWITAFLRFREIQVLSSRQCMKKKWKSSKTVLYGLDTSPCNNPVFGMGKKS